MLAYAEQQQGGLARVLVPLYARRGAAHPYCTAVSSCVRALIAPGTEHSMQALRADRLHRPHADPRILRHRTGANLRAVVLTALQIGLSRRLREGQRIYEALRRHEPSVSGHLALAELCTYHCSLLKPGAASRPGGRSGRQATTGNCVPSLFHGWAAEKL